MTSQDDPVEQDIIIDKNNLLPSINKVILAVKKLNSNRSIGPDNMLSEFLKVNKPELVRALHKIMVNIWDLER